MGYPLTGDIRSAKLPAIMTGREQLEAWLKRTGLTARELAGRLSLTDAHLSQIRSGKRRPGLPIAARFEDVCGIPVRSWLLTKRGSLGKARKPAPAEAQLS